jgi:hypothetical protein
MGSTGIGSLKGSKDQGGSKRYVHEVIKETKRKSGRGSIRMSPCSRCFGTEPNKGQKRGVKEIVGMWLEHG